MLKQLIPAVALVFMAACSGNTQGYSGATLETACSCCDSGHCSDRKTNGSGCCCCDSGHCND